LSSKIDKIREFVREVAEDFNIEPPEIIISTEKTRTECGPNCGCYNFETGRILLSDECVDLDTILHEFAHHYQYLKAGKNPWKAFREIGKAHCERPHEAEAKAFTRAYLGFYSRRWRKIGLE
jgi:hypothetical protein